MTKKEFLHALEEAMAANKDSIRGDESLQDQVGWDSMATVSFIAMADEKLGTLVEPAKLAACKTVSDLIALFPGKIS
jgi:acyl carrier protein